MPLAKNKNKKTVTTKLVKVIPIRSLLGKSYN